MDFKYTLQETLDSRFTDTDEINDICNHGIMGGFHGFIYTYEINEFFNEFENEIEDYYWDMFGDTWMIDSGAANCNDMNSLRAHLVWGLVEMYCNQRLDELEAEEEELIPA